MKILIDAHVFDEIFQGTRTYLKGLYTAVIDIERKNPTGNIYYFAATDVKNLKHEFPEEPFVKYIQLNAGGSFKRLAIEFPRIIKEYKIDYAHFQYVVPFSSGCKFINTIHDLIFLDMPSMYSWRYVFFRKIFFRWSYNKSSIVSTVSEYSKQQLFTLFGRHKKVHVIPNAIDADFKNFQPTYSLQEWFRTKSVTPYFLYVSRFEPRKNHLNLLKAFVEGKFYEQFSLICIGTNSIPSAELDSYYSSLPQVIKQKIIFRTEGVSKNDLLHFMYFASLFIYPSLAEGFGIPPLEAAVLKVPVVCSNKTAMSDFRFFGDNLVDPNSVQSLITAMQRNIDKPVEVHQLQEISEQVQVEYNWHNSATLLLSLINQDVEVSAKQAAV